MACLASAALLAGATPALAAGTPRQPALVATSTAQGATVSVLGTALLELSTSSARSTAAGLVKNVRAQATGVTGVDASNALATRSTNGQTRIPATGQLCGTPDLAAQGVPTAVLSAVQLSAGCAEATATLEDAVSSAVAQAKGLGLKVSADGLADVLAQLVLAPVSDVLTAVTGPVTTVTAELSGAVGTVCAGVPAPANAVCASAVAQLEAVSEPTAQQLLTAITAAISGALEGVDLLTITVGGTGSTTSTTADKVGATAASAGLDITSPSLAFLVDAIRAAVATVLSDYVDAVVAALTSSPAAAAAALLGQQALVDQAAAAVRGTLAPAAQAAITTILDAIVAALPFLADDSPLIQVSGAANRVAVVTARTGGPVAVDAAAGSVVVKLAPTLATLLGVPATTTISAGQDVPLFAGTPLASRVRVGSTSPLSSTDGGVALKGARADGVTIDLLTGVMGGISLALAPVSAQVGAVAGQSVSTPTPVVIPTETLPRTGGSAPWLALVALLAVAGLLQLRRQART